MLTDADLDFAFRRALLGEDDEIDLARAALLLAEIEYPGLDIAAAVDELDALAARVQARPGFGDLDRAGKVRALLEVLFSELGFRGNAEDYYDPKNSFLNEVLERRVGIPITLSLVVMEVAARLGLAVEGIAAPGHFVVRHGGRIYDPFHGGRELGGAELRRLIGDGAVENLAAAGKREIIARMLRNLAAIYQRTSDLVRLKRVRERLAIVEAPGSPRRPVPSA